jgi:hypothetical protein
MRIWLGLKMNIKIEFLFDSPIHTLILERNGPGETIIQFFYSEIKGLEEDNDYERGERLQ